ncbi:MAG: flavodoxin family protein, partial [Oscillospiraceae bacterium]|nr:flavodoxin family protein [Oscillospiraceae bacterium]
AWLLKCVEAGKAAGITLPELEPRVGTNFIRG